jgi:thioredoxin reductase (NADPH)
VSEPVILVVDDDPQVLEAIRRDLRTRYQPEYRVLGAASGEIAVQTMQTLKARADSLAMVVSDQRMPGMLGVEVLAKCRELYPIARCVLLTAYSDIKAAIQAINEVHLDHYLEKPWDPPEERLFPVIDEQLDAWRSEYRPEVGGLRLVGVPWSPGSHAIKDFLGSNLIPYRWFEVGRDPEANALIEAGKIAPRELPALFLENGTLLRNPNQPELIEALGVNMTVTHDLYDLLIVGAGPAGLAAAVYGASEGMRTLLLGPAGRRDQVRGLKTTWDFPWESAAAS